MDSLVGKNGSQVLEIGPFLRRSRRIAVDGLYIEQGRKFLRWTFHPLASLYNIAGLHIKTADLGRGHIDVVVPRQEILTADKSKAVGHNLQNAFRVLAAVQLLQIRAQIGHVPPLVSGTGAAAAAVVSVGFPVEIIPVSAVLASLG